MATDNPKPDTYYASFNPILLEAIPPSARQFLDVASGDGRFGEADGWHCC
jgi:hypothetical protein